MPTPPTLVEARFSFSTAQCGIFNSVPKYNQSYSDCLHVHLLITIMLKINYF